MEDTKFGKTNNLIFSISFLKNSQQFLLAIFLSTFLYKLLVEHSTNNLFYYNFVPETEKIVKMQEFVYALLMVQASYRQAIQKSIREQGIDLTFEMIQVMRCLYRKDTVNQQELANQTHKDKSSLSYLLNNMERRRLITRIENSIDRRSKLIVLTEEGQALHQQIKTLVETVYQKVEESTDKIKLQFCVDYMKELSGIISND